MKTTNRLASWPLPVIGIGTGMWKTSDDEATLAQTRALIHLALERATPAFFDTAHTYGNGYSETALGQGLNGVPREAFILQTKVGFCARDAPTPTQVRDLLLRKVETSLKRLNLPSVDTLLLHDPDCSAQVALDSAFPVLYELRDQGVTRAVGSGMNQWEMLSEFARSADVDCFLLAGRYTLLEQGGLPLLDLCQQRGIAVFLGGVYNTGILATGAQPGALYNYRPAPPQVLERVRRIEALCQHYGFPLRAAAVQFALSHPAVRSLVLGVLTAAEHEQAWEAARVRIPLEFWAELKAEGLLDEEVPVPVAEE